VDTIAQQAVAVEEKHLLVILQPLLQQAVTAVLAELI
jgi:hypothetical protein